MKQIRLRYLAHVNPATPRFDALSDVQSVTFMPLETVWPDVRVDTTRTRAKGEVVTGYVRFQNGDVLVPKVTPTFQAGRSCLVHGLSNHVGAGSTELHVLRAKANVDPRFIRYATQTTRFLREGVSAFQGVAGLQRVPELFVRDFQVPGWTPDEQRRIGDFLDDQVALLDRTIALRQEQIALLAEARVARACHATTIGFGQRSTRSTGVSWMPQMAAHWTLRRVGQTFRTGSGTTPRSEVTAYYNGEFPWVNTGDLRDGSVVETRKSVSQAALDDYPTLRFYDPGALIVAMYGATIGRLGRLATRACVNQACCVLFDSKELSSDFAFYWFLGHRSHVLELATGGGQPNISQETVRNLRIPTPPLSEQATIVAQLTHQDDQARQLADLFERQRDLLAERKQALITGAVMGEFDVTTARSVA